MDLLQLAKNIISGAGNKLSNDWKKKMEEVSTPQGRQAYNERAVKFALDNSMMSAGVQPIEAIPNVAAAASKLSPQIQELLQARTDALKRLDLAKMSNAPANTIKNLDKGYLDIIRTMLQTK